jgi:hypothetical protein
MLNLNYSKYDVLAIFRKDSSGTLNPTASQIAQFDADLFAANDNLLLQIMGQEGVATDKSTKSTVLLYSRFGAGEINQRIRSACRYFKNTQNL